MITITRIVLIAPGKSANAVAFALKIAKFLKDKYGSTVEARMPIGGNPLRVAWCGQYESLAQWEALTGKMLSDKEYIDLVASQGDTFLPGTVHDDIWRSI